MSRILTIVVLLWSVTDINARCCRVRCPVPPTVAQEEEKGPTPATKEEMLRAEKERKAREIKYVWYRGSDNLWYSNIVAGNGQVLYRSTDGYKNKGDMFNGIEVTRKGSPTAKVVPR